MSKIVVLGGAGAVGSVVSMALARSGKARDVVIADANLDKAEQVAHQSGAGCARSTRFDAMSRESVAQVISGAALVVNCVGPFYKTVRNVLEAVIAARINYVDVCDDVDATLDILGMDGAAREAGVSALIGMGASPGVTNLLARMAAEGMLDETERIDIFHAHGGEPFEGAGVVGHRFHCMSVDIPMFLDGKLEYVKYFEPSGIALRQKFDFPVLGEGIEIYPYPHPEQITLPRYLKVRNVTNKGTVLPQEYYELTRDICALGLASKEPVQVGGGAVVPYDFSVAYILRERERILKETGFGRQRGCCSVVARGTKRGKALEIRFHMASESQGLGEGTGLPAAIGALLMLDGRIKGPGVLPPEACVSPAEFLSKAPAITRLLHEGEGDKRFSGLLVQRIDETGRMTETRL